MARAHWVDPRAPIQVLDGGTDLERFEAAEPRHLARGRLEIPELARWFRVGEATAKRIVSRFRETGSIEPKPYGGRQ